LREAEPEHLRLDQGSHIVVRRLFPYDCGYVLQTKDRRIVFALPFERDFTLIGTTDGLFSGSPDAIAPGADEIAYLCAVVNDHFRAGIAPASVVWSFAGVRSLYDDGWSKPQDTPRDYTLLLDGAAGKAPLLTVYGGKITTYRRVAEAVLDRLAPALGTRPAWTKDSSLPGGDFSPDDMPRLVAQARRSWSFLGEAHALRLLRAYGTRVSRILGSAKTLDDLGPRLGADLTGAEVRYLMNCEWAQTADDVLLRRSKLALRVCAEERERLAKFMAD
jgi:glycerol-3-phosphate dehydrogenase